MQHQAPELEDALPSSVAGRSLAKWSVRGRCWLDVLFSAPFDVDGLVASFETAGDARRIDLSHLAFAVAGRSNTSSDPPNFVFAAARPQDEDEIGLAMALLFIGAHFIDIERAGDLTLYERRTIAGKDVYAGTTSMLAQNEHQRGSPFLYQNDQTMFLVITDDEPWASEALGQLP